MYCVFAKSTNRNSYITLLFKSRMANFTTQVAIGKTRIQYARDDEEPYFCINQNNNIDNELYCYSHE